MIVLLGNIYDEKENEIRGLSGFILFIFTAQLGGFLAPLITSFLKAHWGYTSIFLLAATCGLVALLFFIQFTRSSRNPDTASVQQTDPSIVSERKQNNVILLSVLITALVTWFSLQLRGTTLVTALKDLTDRGSELSAMLVPMEKYLLPLIMLLFAWWISRNKMMHWGSIFCIMLVGLAFAIAGYLIIAGFASLTEIIQDKIVIYLFFSFLLIAESLLTSTFLYAVYRSSPMKHKGLFQGIYHLVIAVSTSLFFLGRSLYEIMGAGMFALIAGLLLIVAIMLLRVKKNVV
jgi:MFS family permease